MVGAVVSPVLALIQNDLGISPTTAGFIITTHGLTIALVSPLVGRLVDTWGVRLPLAIGLVAYSLGGGMGVIADTFLALILSRVILGLGAAAVFTATTVGMLALYPVGAERDRVMGWRTTAITVGGVVWPLLAGALGNADWHHSFAVYLIGLPLALVVPFVWPATARADTTNDHAVSALGLLATSPRLIGLLGIVVASGMMMYVPAVFLPKRLEQIGIESTVMVALYGVVLASVTASIIGLAYSWLSARLSHAWMLGLSAGGWAIGLVIYALVDQSLLLMVAPILTGMGNALSMPTLTVLVADSAPPQARGRATSLLSTAMFTGQFISPLVVGPLIAATSYQIGFLAGAGLAGAIVLAVALTRGALPPPPGS
jgi:MFS family permease